MLVDELICSDFVMTGMGELISPLKPFFVYVDDNQHKANEIFFQKFSTKNVYISTTIKLRKDNHIYPAYFNQHSVDYFEHNIQKQIPIRFNHFILETDLNFYKEFLEQDLYYLLSNSASRISINVNGTSKNNFKNKLNIEGVGLLSYYLQGNGSSMSEVELSSWAVNFFTRYNSKK